MPTQILASCEVPPWRRRKRSYLLSEDCEGTGTPSGWTDAASFPPQWDYTPAIRGTQSVHFPTSSEFTDSPSFAPASDIHAFFAINVGAASGNISIFRLRDSGATAVASFAYRGTTAVFRMTHGSVNSAESPDMGDAGTYYVWLQYTAGSGTDGVMRCWISATPTKPGTETIAAITTGTSAAPVESVRLSGHGSGITFDWIRVSTTAIGNSPA